MKNKKKLLAVLFATVMIMAMGITAFAADGDPATYKITITKDATDKTAHTYGAFQIFKGDLSVEGNTKTLSNIQWGDNVNGATAITELKKINTFSNLAADATAATVAKAISDANVGNDSATARAIAEAFNQAITGDPKGTVAVAANANKGEITGLVAGYYLVKDTGIVENEGAYTRFILEVVSDVNVSEKADIPSVEKKVKETNDTTGAITNWQDGADYDIGDEIPYKLTGTLPGTFDDYDSYTVYKFTDTLSAGLTPPAANKVKVTLGTEGGIDITDLFDVAVSGQVLTVSLKSGKDLKKDNRFSATSKIIVTYNATLNNNAVIGSMGNPNTVFLEFTNNPNYGGDGIGKTPEDKVIVFTYEINALKVEADGDPIDEATYNALSETEKANYVLVNGKYQKTKALEGAGFTLYKKVPAGTTGAVDGYLKIGDEIKGVTSFEFKGTDAGEYKLVETTVPKGFNKADDIKFTVEATYDTEAADPKLKTLEVKPATAGFTVTTTKVEGDDAHITTDGIIKGKIINEGGAVLPSTGGIGTTIFYVIGAILVLGAGVVLIARRRTNA